MDDAQNNHDQQVAFVRNVRATLTKKPTPFFPYDRKFYCAVCEGTTLIVFPDDIDNVHINPRGNKAVIWCPCCDNLVVVTK